MPNAQYSSTMIPFEEAIAFHLQKLQLPSESWRDLQGSIHARAFTVAGATNLALLNDLHQAVTAAISNGDTLQDFRKKFDVAVAKYGWSYKGKRGWRTNVIYQNNKNTANAAGRWTQQQRVKGTVDLRKISQTDTVTGEVIEKFPGVDLGWDYNPGMAWVAPDIALGRELVKLPPAISALYKANIAVPNSVVLVSGAIAQQLSATMPNAMQDLMALLANADQAQYGRWRVNGAKWRTEIAVGVDSWVAAIAWIALIRL